MKKLLISAALMAGLAGAAFRMPSALGQNGASRANPPAATSRVALLDLGLVFQRYKKLEDLQQTVKTAAEAAAAREQQMHGQGQDLEKSLRDGTLEQGSADYLEREKKVVQLMYSVKTFHKMTERNLKQQGAKAFVAAYEDVRMALAEFAQQNGYTLVLRVDREALDCKNYQTVQRSLSQDVVRQDSRDDITDAVVAYLNRQYDAAGSDAVEAPAAKKSEPRRPSPAPAVRTPASR